MKIHLYIQNLLLALIIIYLAQGSFYATGSVISQAALLLFLSISLIYFGKTIIVKNKASVFKIWTGLLFLNIIGFIFTGDWSNPQYIGTLKVICFGFFGFYPFYYFAKINILKRKHLVAFFFFMTIVSIYAFYNYRTEILLERTTDNENVVNNMTYMFVYLIPFVFLIGHKKLLSIIFIVILLYFTILGSKRGAFITGLAGFLIYAYYFFKNTESKYKFRTYLLGVIILGVIIYLGYQQLETNEYFISRLENTGKSKEIRNFNFADLWNVWVSSDSYLNLLFGYGFAASLTVGRYALYAHNDWLELLTSFGLLGVILYGLLFYNLYKLISKNKLEKERKALLLCTLLVWFLPTLFSMGIYSYNFIFTVILLTYSMAPKES